MLFNYFLISLFHSVFCPWRKINPLSSPSFKPPAGVSEFLVCVQILATSRGRTISPTPYIKAREVLLREAKRNHFTDSTRLAHEHHDDTALKIYKVMGAWTRFAKITVTWPVPWPRIVGEIIIVALSQFIKNYFYSRSSHTPPGFSLRVERNNYDFLFSISPHRNLIGRSRLS